MTECGIVFLLEDAKAVYTYHEHSFPIPPEEKAKFPLGMLPVLEVTSGGKKNELYQTLPILRFLAKVHGYAGKDEYEFVAADIAAQTADELFEAWAGVVFGGKSKGEYTIVFKKYTTNLEKHLTSTYVAGETVTLGDFALFDIMMKNIDLLGCGAYAEYPRIQKFYENFKARPNIAAFLGSDRMRIDIPLAKGKRRIPEPHEAAQGNLPISTPPAQ